MYEENNIEYMPNRMYKYLLVVFLWIIIWIIREIKYIMTHINSTDTEIILFFVFLLCISVVCGVACYRLSKLKIIFTKDAIYIKHHGQQEVNVYYYEDYLYAYYSRSYKAALYLVLSEKHLDFKQIKRVINITTRFGKTVVENCVVIYLDENKSADLIKQLISERIVNIISFENKNY